MAERAEADGEAGLGDARAVSQSRGGLREAHVEQQPMWRPPLELGEHAGKVKQTHAGFAREDFIGIGMEEAPFADRATTLEGARAFHATGGHLTSLTFPETRAQVFGDAVVLYGRYEAVIETGGVSRTLRGRLTETLVRRGRTWLHPGWHLDLTTGPAR
jgi:hypothetical protein